MLDILEEHLRTGASPETYAMVNQAWDLFQQFGLDDIDVGYTEILLMGDNEGASETITKICDLTTQYQDAILSQLQIDLVDEATVSEGNLILMGMKKLEHYEHMDLVAQVCEENRQPEEALAEILTLVTGVEEERLLILIETVGDKLIESIATLAHGGSDLRELQDVETVKVYAQNLMAYYEAVDHVWLYVYDAVQKGEALGKPYAEYHSEIIVAMEEKQVTERMLPKQYSIALAVQLFAGAIVSVDGKDNPRLAISNELAKTYGDLDRVTPVYMEVDSLTIKFQSYLQGATALTKPTPPPVEPPAEPVKDPE